LPIKNNFCSFFGKSFTIFSEKMIAFPGIIYYAKEACKILGQEK